MMTRQIMAGLLAAAALIPGIATAQDSRHDDRGGRARAEHNDGDRQRHAHDPQRADRNAQRRPVEANRQRGDERRNVAIRDREQPRAQNNRDRDGRPDYRRDAVRGASPAARFDQRRYDQHRGDGYRGQAYRTDTRRAWSNNWRQDRRYDWREYRSYNRGAFNLPRYYAPYGWNYGYRRFSVGVRLATSLFAQSYWIGDPWEYRLPAAGYGYRWVRYYNDAILVDVRTGYTVDVIHDIFW